MVLRFCSFFLVLVLFSSGGTFSAEKHVEEVVLDIEFAKKRFPTSVWYEKLEKIFLQPDAEYEITINLNKFSSDNVKNINIFLETLGKLKTGPVCKKLCLLNSTSQKFNMLSSGIKRFFSRPDVTDLVYGHRGTVRPRAAEEGFKKIAEDEACTVFSENENQLQLAKINVNVIDSSELKDVKLGASFAKEKFPTNEWVKRIPEIFSVSEKYRIVIDLEKLYSFDLRNINYFLEFLGSSSGSGIYEELCLRNSTSQKFNKLSSGIKRFFQRPEVKRVIYCQGGKVKPRTAEKKLREVEGGNLETTADGFVLHKIDDDLDVSSYVDSAVDSERDFEIEEELYSIHSKWEDLDPTNSIFPLGLDSLNEKIIDVCIGDKSPIIFKGDKFAFLKVSGVMSADVENIFSLCVQNKDIRCLSIIDSDCSLQSMSYFFDSIGHGGLEFFDVRSAFEYSDPLELFRELRGFLEKKQKIDLLPHFIWFSQEQLEYVKTERKVTEDVVKYHRLFSLIEQYLAIVNSRS